MRYVLEGEAVSLLFLCVVAVHFFSRYMYHSRKNQFFALIMCFSICDIVLDVVGSLAIEHSTMLSLELNMVLNTAFYFTQLVIPVLFFFYILCLTDKLDDMSVVLKGLLLVPLIMYLVVLVLNPVIRAYFYFDENLVYRHGFAYYHLYICTFFYLLSAFAALVAWGKKIRKVQFITIVALVLINFTCMGIQFFVPHYLLTGVGLALSVLMMYLTLQNPTEMSDDLTGLFNRFAFVKCFSQIQRGKRTDKMVICIALDGTRNINHVFGMDIGNEVLIAISDFLQKNMKHGLNFRLNGDQFLIVADNKEYGMKYIQMLQDYFKNPIHLNKLDVQITACICYSDRLLAHQEEEDAILTIEYAMAELKKQGNSQIGQINQNILNQIQRQLEVQNILKRAVEEETLEVYLQPIYSNKEKRYVGAEALLRLHDDELGWIPPVEFIPIAEKNGLIMEIGSLVLRKICAFVRENHLDQNRSFKSIDVNLSVLELMQLNMVDQLLDIMENYEIRPDFICFEMTESTANNESTVLQKNMEALIAHKIPFALDDFGTGYANFDTITRLPFSELKIDRSLMLSSFENEKSEIVCRAVVQMSNELGIHTIVEGVETAEQADMVHNQLGVDLIQGYYYGKPMTMSEFIKKLDS